MSFRSIACLAAIALLVSGGDAFASAPANVRAFDAPGDSGRSILLTWDESRDDGPGVEYVVEVATAQSRDFRAVARLRADRHHCRDAPESFGFFAYRRQGHCYHFSPLEAFPPTNDDERQATLARTYWFRVGAAPTGASPSQFCEPVAAAAKGNWFDLRKLNNFVFMIVYSGAVLFFIQYARRNRNIFLRKIAGLDAIDDALGRATEMGRPVLFVNGLGSMGSLSNIASVNILGRVARRVAEYNTALVATTPDPIVLSVSQEIVREAYTEAGRPDRYNPDSVRMAATGQFPYVMAVGGIMLRERPAAHLFMGAYGAESLILAETGASTGAIQIAGTDSYPQLPFFVTACDYTLMGEELYAASAYLSREPRLLGSLRGQDFGKAIIGAGLLSGSALSSAQIVALRELFRVF